MNKSENEERVIKRIYLRMCVRARENEFECETQTGSNTNIHL